MPPATNTKDDSATRIAKKLVADKERHMQQNPNITYTVRTAADCIRAQLAIEFPKAKRTSKVNGRDQLFDAIAEGCGLELTELSRGSSGAVATAKRDILEATPDVTPEEVARRIKAYVAKYRGAACTPMALANHWPEFGQPSEGRTRGAKRDIYTEPPITWRAVAKKLWPVAKSWITAHDFETMAWADVNADLRREILAKLYL